MHDNHLTISALYFNEYRFGNSLAFDRISGLESAECYECMKTITSTTAQPESGTYRAYKHLNKCLTPEVALMNFTDP